MTEKVKMSVFVESDVARAVKMQSASQGTGVSQIIRSIFLCAHCGEPITDEFMVGSPKLTEHGKDGNPDKYSVFFHKHRDQCRLASGQRIGYVPLCDQCKKPAYQSFDETYLNESLAKNEVIFYCMPCEHFWRGSNGDKMNLTKLLAEHQE